MKNQILMLFLWMKLLCKNLLNQNSLLLAMITTLFLIKKEKEEDPLFKKENSIKAKR